VRDFAGALWVLTILTLAGSAWAFFGLGWGLLAAGLLLMFTVAFLVLPGDDLPGRTLRYPPAPPPPLWTSTTTRPEEAGRP